MARRVLPEYNAAPRRTLKIMIFFFFQPSSEVHIVTLPNIVLFFGIILSIGNAIIILRSRQREETHNQQIILAKTYKENWENALKETERLEDKLQVEKTAKEKATDEADLFRGSYTALASVNIKELINFDKMKRERDALEIECIELNQKLIRQNRK